MKTSTKFNLDKTPHGKIETLIKRTNDGFFTGHQNEGIDFLKNPTLAILFYLKANKKDLYAWFTTNQLTNAMNASKQRLFQKSIIVLSVSVFSLASMSKVFAQSGTTTLKQHENAQETYVVKGTVLDDQGLPLIGVNVVLKGSNEGVVTDFNGRFEFSRPLSAGETLVFSYIGFEPKEHTIEKSELKTIDLTLNFEASDIILMGEIAIDGLYSSKGKKSKKSNFRTKR